MALSYQAKGMASADLAKLFFKHGWRVFGYHNDNSDSMVDYFDPATWHGAAWNESLFPKYTVVVNFHNLHGGGGDVIKSRFVKDRKCERCGGHGVLPDWSYQTAQKDPRTFNLWYAKEVTGGGTPMFPDVISPLHFKYYDLPEYGAARWVHCPETTCANGWVGHIEEYVAETFPRFLPVKNGFMWHVEYNGKVIRSGRGYSKIYHARYGEEHDEAVKSVYSEIVATIGRHMAGGAKSLRTADSAPQDAPKVWHKGDWTWVRWPAGVVPSEDVRERIKALGFTFSRRRMSWYARERVPVEDVEEAIQTTEEKSND